MDVSVHHSSTGHSCTVSVAEDGTVLSLKKDALEAMFADSTDESWGAADLVARIEGCEEELDDECRVADTGLEDGGAVRLVPRWPIKSPAVYSSGHRRQVQCIAMSGCGRLCAVGYLNGHITVFGTSTGAEVAHFTQGEDPIRCCTFSTCGTWLATSSDSICVWKTTTWEQVRRFGRSTAYCAAWTHCGRLVSGDRRGTLRVWDLKDKPSATALSRGHTEPVRSIAVSGTSIFSGSDDNSIRVWDVSTLTHTRTLTEHTNGVPALALTKDGLHLVSCSWDMSLKVWRTASLRCLRTVQLDSLPFSLDVSHRGDIVAVKASNSATLYRLTTGDCLGKVDMQGNGVALSPCGRWVFTPMKFTFVSVFDMYSLSR